MTQDPFKDFENSSVKSSTSNKVLISSSEIMNPKTLNLSLKYSALFLSSVLVSLSLCPQKGVGLFSNDIPFFHHLLHQSKILCGLYCGFVFFTTTHLLTFFLLSHFERVKITKHVSYLPALFMSAFFGLSMTSFFSEIDLGWSYNLSWLLIVGTSYYLSNRLFLNKLQQR